MSLHCPFLDPQLISNSFQIHNLAGGQLSQSLEIKDYAISTMTNVVEKWSTLSAGVFPL